jgi:hypothetical protein
VLADQGEPIFQRHCASCHAAGRAAMPRRGHPAHEPADLTRIAKRRNGEFPTGKIAQFIDGRFVLPAHGSREMRSGASGSAPSRPDLGESVSRGNSHARQYLKPIQQPPLGNRR